MGLDIRRLRTHPGRSSGYEIGLGDNKIHNLAAHPRYVQPYGIMYTADTIYRYSKTQCVVEVLRNRRFIYYAVR